MNSFDKPQFQLQRVFSDGTSDEPQIYRLTEIDSHWNMGRRGFFGTAAAITALGVAGCARKPIKDVDISTQKQGVSIHHGSVEQKITQVIREKGNYIAKAHLTDPNSLSRVALKFSPKGNILASYSPEVDDDETVKLWEMPSGKLLKILNGHPYGEISFSPNGNFIAFTDGKSSTITLWNIPSNTSSTILRGHTDWVESICFITDGSLLASCSRDKTIKLWDVASGNLRKTLKGHTDEVNSISFNPIGSILASCSDDKTIYGTYHQALYARHWRVIPMK